MPNTVTHRSGCVRLKRMWKFSKQTYGPHFAQIRADTLVTFEEILVLRNTQEVSEGQLCMEGGGSPGCGVLGSGSGKKDLLSRSLHFMA